MFLFYVLSFFKKGDTIQGGTLFEGEHYLRKYGICKICKKKMPTIHNFILLTNTYKYKTNLKPSLMNNDYLFCLHNTQYCMRNLKNDHEKCYKGQ